MSNFYAVRNGKIPGIYNLWSECNEQINGFSCAVFKKFKSFEDAQKYMNIGIAPKIKEENKDLEKDRAKGNGLDIRNRVVIYTDGSYKNGVSGGARYCVNTLTGYFGQNPISYTVSRGELMGIYLALNFDPYDNLHLYVDSEYARNVVDGIWPATHNQDMLDMINKVKEHRHITFHHVYSHTNNKYNDLVDKYAEQSTHDIKNKSDDINLNIQTFNN